MNNLVKKYKSAKMATCHNYAEKYPLKVKYPIIGKR